MKKLFLLLLIIVCKFTIAQNTLNIFTHQGEKFILFLNGEQINLLPESKVKKENISATVQNVRIEFENKNNLQITENIYYEAGNYQIQRSLLLLRSLATYQCGQRMHQSYL